MMVVDYPDRRFQVWRYLTSHSQLLLRSPKSHDDDVRIDILFTDVDWVNVPTIMNGLKLRHANSKDGQLQAFPSGVDAKWNKILLVEGRDYSGFIIAGGVAIDESDRQYHEADVWGVYQLLADAGRGRQ